MLTADELTDYRQTMAGELPDTAIVIRNFPTPDGMGGDIDFPVSQETYPCLVQQSRQPIESVSAEKITSGKFYNIFLPFDAGVNPRDRLQVGNDIYEVAGNNAEETNRLLVVVVATKIK